jgi:hypothetical protein
MTMAKSIKNGWFSETDAMLPGQKFSLALHEFSEKSILYNQKSDFQEILVFQSAQYGNILVLDGVLRKCGLIVLLIVLQPTNKLKLTSIRSM